MSDTVTTEAAPAASSFTGDYGFLQNAIATTETTDAAPAADPTPAPEAKEEAKAETPFDISALPPEIREKVEGYDRYAPVLSKLQTEGVTDAAAFDQRIQAQQAKEQETKDLENLRAEIWNPIWQKQQAGLLTAEQAAEQYAFEAKRAEDNYHIQKEMETLREAKMNADLDRAAPEFPLFNTMAKHEKIGQDARNLALFLAASYDVPVVEAVAVLNGMVEPLVKQEVAAAIAQYEKSKQAQTPLPAGNSVALAQPKASGNFWDDILQESRRNK